MTSTYFALACPQCHCCSSFAVTRAPFALRLACGDCGQSYEIPFNYQGKDMAAFAKSLSMASCVVDSDNCFEAWDYLPETMTND